MNVVYQTALEVQSFCQSHGWRFCFIGGVALQRWGEPRQTVDVDLTIITGFGGEEIFVDALLKRFRGRHADTREFALLRRVVLLENAQGTGVDVALGGLPFEQAAVERAVPYVIKSGHSLLVCSAEDLIVHKCFASRGQDWADVENVLIKQRGKLNLPLIFSELQPLAELKGEPEIMEHLKRLVKKWNG